MHSRNKTAKTDALCHKQNLPPVYCYYCYYCYYYYYY